MFDYSKMFDLSGRRALVIGGASGIGQASALGLAAHGAEVVVADVNVALAEETVDEIKKSGGKAAAMKIDMRDKANIEAAAQSLGALDALVVTPSINVRKPLLDLTDEEFDRVVDLNLKGVFRVLRAFAPPMAARGKGSIVAFSSVRAQVVEPGQGVYAATKAGTLQMIRALAAELGTSGRAPQRRRAGRGRDAADQADHRERGLVSRLRRQIDAEALGQTRPRWPARWCSFAPTQVPTSPALICWSTAVGRLRMVASLRRCRKRQGEGQGPRDLSSRAQRSDPAARAGRRRRRHPADLVRDRQTTLGDAQRQGAANRCPLRAHARTRFAGLPLRAR